MNDWLESTVQLQLESYGFDFKALSPEALMEYITWNVTALTVELGEVMNELPWKPWAKGRGKLSQASRDRAVSELVDVAHFLANICCGLQVTDEEWDTRYREKQDINRARQASGSYRGRFGDAGTTEGNAGSAVDRLPVEEATGTGA